MIVRKRLLKTATHFKIGDNYGLLPALEVIVVTATPKVRKKINLISRITSTVVNGF